MKSLYKKYRPLLFSEVVGQEIAKSILINSIKEDKVNHAYLFFGSRGTGKTTLARIFSKSLNCKNIKDTIEPCNECNVCKDINNSSSLDVIEIDAASNNGVDEIRKINENLNYSTTYSEYKIYIIDEVHMLSKSAFNALLKNLEEPPKKCIFLLATTEINKIPETILSRTININLSLLQEKEIISYLEKILKLEKIKYEKEALRYISIISSGSIRDAVTITESSILFSKTLTLKNLLNVLGLISFEEIENIINKKTNIINVFSERNLDYKKILNLFIDFFIKKILIKEEEENFIFLEKLIDIKTSIKDIELIKYSLISLFSYFGKEKNKKIKSNFSENELETYEQTNTKKILKESEKKYITDYVGWEDYATTILNNNIEKTKKLSKKFDILEIFSSKSESKKYIKLFLDSKIIYFYKNIALILFENEDIYNEYKKISLEKNLILFLNEVFNEKIFLLPVTKEKLNKIEKNCSILKKQNKKMNKKNNLDEIFNFDSKEKYFFGKKIEVLEK